MLLDDLDSSRYYRGEMTSTARVLVLASAAEGRVRRVVGREIALHGSEAVTVGVPEPEAWRYERLGCSLLTLGEEGFDLTSAAARAGVAEAGFDLLVMPIGFPRPGFGQLLRLVGEGAPLLVRVETWAGIRIANRWLVAAYLGLLFVALHLPVRLLVRLLRSVDGAVLLLLQQLARTRRSRWHESPGEDRPLCHVINSLHTGGAQRNVVDYVLHCRERGKVVHLLLLHRDTGHLGDELRDSGVVVEVIQDRIEANVVSRCFLAAFPRVAMVWAVASRLRALRPAYVWSWLFLANVVTATAGRLVGVPRIICSELGMSDWKTWPQYRHWWYRPADRLAALLADRMVVNAAALVRDFASWARLPIERITFIPNGINATRLLSAGWRDVRDALDLPPDIPLVLAVGRLAPVKDYPLLLRSLARVKTRGVECRLVILGEGALLSELEACTRELGLADWVRFPGRSAQPQSFYRSADVFALSSRIEGMPNVLMEAQLFGLPAVTTSAGGAAEVVEDGQTGFVVDIGDEAAFAVALERLLLDPSLRARFGQEAHRRVLEKFSWDRVGSRMDAMAERRSSGG
jgi:glycosyltransferase involved in cell wall biosynthesis